MKIKSNIKFITILPAVLLIILSSYILISEYFNFQRLQQTKVNIVQIQSFKNLLVDLSKERGLSTLSIGQNSNQSQQALQKQRKTTNDSIQQILNIYNSDKENKLTYKIIKEVKKIVSLRAIVDKKEISYHKLYRSYDKLFSDILTKIEILNFPSNYKIDRISKSYIKSITLLKSITDERDFISNIFSSNDNIDNLYMLKILKDSSIYQTFSSLDNDAKNIVDKHLNNKNFINIIKKSDRIKKNILKNGYDNTANIQIWYGLEDEKLNNIQNVTNIIYTNLKNRVIFNNEFSILKIFLSFILIPLSFYMIFKYFKLKKYIIDNHNLKLLLQKSVDASLLNKKIDLDSSQGIDEAYSLLDSTLDKIEIERQKAENENASKSIFLANMSHEIRTPINGIVGFTDLLKKANLPRELKEYVEIISKSTDNLLEIINNILDLSKIESKKVEVDQISFSPVEEFENAVDLFIPKAAKKSINLSIYMDPNFESYLVGDALKVKEVLLNLISNSIKFTPNNGKIAVRIKKLESDNENEKVYFEVTDNGIGMSESELSEVFDAFTQADSTITRKYGGTGLGLTISSNYISLLGGKLEVFSKKDDGASFYFTLEFKKSQPLKIAEYKNKFSDIKPLIITDNKNENLAEFFLSYLSFFTTNANYIKVEEVEQNISLFDRSNLIVITDEIYKSHDFSYLEKTNKKLLIVKPTVNYLDKITTDNTTLSLVEPISFFKVVEILSNISTQDNLSLLEHKSIAKKTKKDKYHILVAEDNAINIKLMEQLFNQYKNITLKKANDGQEAVDLVLKNRFDLILMDIAMPVMDGLSATKKIIEYENINSLPHTPIIALTANALKGDKERFLSIGMDEYISKPVKENTLIDMLNKFSIHPCDTYNDEAINKEEILYMLPSKSKSKILKEDNTKDILIYKKSKVETKIFEKVLSSIYKKIDIANSNEEFFEKIQTNLYQAILLDQETHELNIDKLVKNKDILSNTALILFRNFETRVSDKLRVIFDEVIINSADKNYLKLILDNYIKKEE